MATLSEGKLKFAFPDAWIASKYDDWSYYRNQFQKVCGGAQAVDIVAFGPDRWCWLIEIKDYREHQRTKPRDIADEMAGKIRDTLAGLSSGQHLASDAHEKAQARDAVRSIGWRVVLHLEQPKGHSKLFPRTIKLADVLQKLKQLIKAIDPHPQVVERANSGHLPWKVTTVGGTTP